MFLKYVVNNGLIGRCQVVVDADFSRDPDPMWHLEGVKRDIIASGYSITAVHSHPTEKGVYALVANKE